MAEAKGGRSLVLDAITHRYPGGAIARWKTSIST